MRKSGLLFFALILIALLLDLAPSKTIAGAWLSMSASGVLTDPFSGLVVKVKKKKNKCQGEIACPPGYVVLDKPNKYGACCEPKKGFCPPDRPSGTPPNCCAEGTTFREGACRPTNCPPGTVGTPPHCQRTCGPDKVLVGQTCYDPCPAGTTGTPPNCSPSVPPAGGTKPYCITCGGPGCLQKAPACPSGGLTTCTDVPGKTYYNCCCP